MGDYRNYDFGNADTNAQGGSELIPDGTLAWAIVTVRPYNEQRCLTPSKSSSAAYLDVELTILEGKHARRKVWDRIGLEGSEKWVARGMSSVRHILEVGRKMSSFNPGQSSYRLGSQGGQGDFVFMELNELQCAIKIGIEKGKDGYEDKNVVRAYLSPNPTSDTHKAFMKLIDGETEPAPKTQPASAAATWGGSAKSNASSAQPQRPQGGGVNKPSWAGAAPMLFVQAEDDNIPF